MEPDNAADRHRWCTKFRLPDEITDAICQLAEKRGIAATQLVCDYCLAGLQGDGVTVEKVTFGREKKEKPPSEPKKRGRPRKDRQ